MRVQDVLAQYQGRIVDLQTAIQHLRLPYVWAVCILGSALGAGLVLSLYAIRGQMSFFWPVLTLLPAAASAARLRQVNRSESRLWRLKRYYERALDRVKGNWIGTGVRGQEFANPQHVYANDLSLFGEGSLFELLCTARTSIGRRELANYLLQTVPFEETHARQEAIRELKDGVQLREQIATLGEFEFLESRQATFWDWLNSPPLSFSPGLPIITSISSSVLAGIILAALLGIAPWIDVAMWMLPLVAFHAGVGLFFRAQVNRMAEEVRTLSSEIKVLREGLLLLDKQQFRSAKLKLLAEGIRGAAADLQTLDRLLTALEQRNREWFYGPSLLLIVGTQLCMAIEQWRKKNARALMAWLEAWANFEALNALAGYAYENPEHTFPELSEGRTCFVARDLGHPLLGHESCVANDVALNRDSAFFVISGSNMSGKSTLLRAIGLSAVLALAGAPVRASALRLSALSVVASISVGDSLLNGKSKFLAEVDRLRQAIDPATPDRPVLFLIDEIFSGTNSHDRRIAAEAVVRTLVNRGAIGALSTHDLSLTEIATTSDLAGANMHMGSIEGAGPLDFDYRLKPGIATETNALAIARLAGVPV